MISFAIPGDLSLPTGGYEYARRVLVEWGEAARVVSLPGSYPFPSDADLVETAAALATGGFLIDGLAYGAFSEEMAAEIGPRSAVLLHHPLCDEQGLDTNLVEQFEENERRALAHAGAVIATSPSTARDLVTRFGVLEEKLTVAIPGTDLAPHAALTGEPPRLLAVGTVTPRKGYRDLIAALSVCSDLGWTCDVVGAADRDAGETARVEAAIEAAGLHGRVTLCGAVDDIGASYLSADLFVSSSLHEGYGMAVVEAMAHGLPVVTTTAGALTETAPCARLVAPGDTQAMADALRPLIARREERVALGQTCRAFAEGLPGWDETARIVARAVEAVR